MSKKAKYSLSEYWAKLLQQDTETLVFDVESEDNEYFDTAREAACFKLLSDEIPDLNSLDLEFKRMLIDGTKLLRSQYGIETYHLIKIADPVNAEIFMDILDRLSSLGRIKKSTA